MFAKTVIALAATVVLGTASAALAQSQVHQVGPVAATWHAGKHFSATEKAWFDRASMQSTM
jgi:hypothetical protein